MKKNLFLIAILSVFLNGCSGATSPANNSANNQVAISNTANNSGAAVVQNADANLKTQNADANSFPANSLGRKTGNSNSTEKPKITFVPAPHNSEVATRMGEQGEFIQVRVFKADAQIKMMEHIVTTNKFKLFLKNGKVLDVTVDEKFDSERFVNISPPEILILAGLLKKPDASQTGGK